MQRIKSVDFAVPGLAGSLGYRLINSGGSITTARTNVGVVAIGSGAYFALITIPDSWDGIILWDDGKTPRVYAHEAIDKNVIGIGTLLNRIQGSVKQATTGTFSYSLIAQIGTHLNARIPGSLKQAITGTFSYSNIALIANLGTHLQSRIQGTVGLAVTLTQLGTHLNVRIRGSVATKGAMGSIQGATFDPTTDSLEQIRNNSSGGSAPSYIGSVLWSKNPNNFTTGDTFGQRINKILERTSSGTGSVAIAGQVFSEKEKQLLFEWIKVMLGRMKIIEEVVGALNPETKKIIGEFFVSIKINQARLEEGLQRYIKLDTKQKEGIKGDLDFIATSFEEIANMNTNVSAIKNSLINLGREIPNAIKEIPLKDISTTVTLETKGIKNLVSQSINISSDIIERLKKNLALIEEQKKALEFTDKMLLKMMPAEKLKNLLDETHG